MQLWTKFKSTIFRVPVPAPLGPGLPFPVLLLLFLLGLMAAILLMISLFNYRQAADLKVSFLQNKAVSIAQTYEAIARNRQVRSPRDLQTILDEWPEDPYLYTIAIIDRDGLYMAHRNSTKVGHPTEPSPLLQEALDEQRLASHFIYPAPGGGPASGNSLFEVFLPLHLGGFEGEGLRAPGLEGNYRPKFKVLQIQLRQEAAGHVTQGAIWQLSLVGIFLLGTLILASHLIQTLRRYFILEMQARQQARMASLGQVSAWVAHEVRNPLGAIKGLVQLVLERLLDLPADPPTIRQCEIAIRESERLEHFVNHLLVYSRLPNPQASLWKLEDFFTEIFQLLRPSAQAQDVDMFLDLTPTDLQIHADRSQMHQVFLNLLQNSLQAMPAGGDIHLRVFKHPTENTVTMIVEDDGIGLPPDKEESIFEPFFSTRDKGTGLGLAICREIITRHEGTIVAENIPEGGARFIIRLPERSPV